ncbi:DNA cytosine methyltransferase [Streptomyces acidiscabies]|uniref:DNA cytosine methyltransferase n=1 Tax=Streptomyces acidiscabies TaxID=42234 RepID=UPI0039BF19B4
MSVAGRRAGLAPDTRSGLWHHVARAIEALQPCLVVIENVRGILTSPAHPLRDLEPCPWCLGNTPDQRPLRALGAVLGSLADLRYDAKWLVLPASAVGAPHRRERLFLTATPQNPHQQPRHQRRLPTPRQTPNGRPRPQPRGRDTSRLQRVKQRRVVRCERRESRRTGCVSGGSGRAGRSSC